ncbi:hypothetical protein OG756_18055 [Streptomyces sp. NBC_01310]|uniref:hypothetical protein n=1 Tax=Streptomyces sp. NBC_01310 TaxID=2903820 RepID=UPI0035B60E70|nr:hypothetical protein OG756_18055 [Streptomyces sp. NBC_01310]
MTKYLVDKSTWARTHLPTQADIASGAGPARDVRRHRPEDPLQRAQRRRPGARPVRTPSFDRLPLTDEIGERAIGVQGLPAQSGDHRRASLADLLTC